MANSIPHMPEGRRALDLHQIDRGGFRKVIISHDTMPVIFKRGPSG
jgi:hypothetical protein